MLAAFAYWGFRTGNNLAERLVFGLGAPLVAATIWGLFMAPKSSRRLSPGWYSVVDLVLFGLSILAVYAAGLTVVALVYACIYAANRILMVVWNQ